MAHYKGIFRYAALLLTLLFPASRASSSVNSPEPAPDFTLTSTDGTTWSMSELKGKTIVLEWTNPGCPFVVRHYEKEGMPGLQRKYAEQGVLWFTVNSTNAEHENYLEAADLAAVYSKWESAATAHLMDADGKAGKSYGAKTTPHIFIIDSNGNLAYQGAVDDDPRGKKERKDRINYVDQALGALLAGAKPAVSSSQPYGCSVKYSK